MEVDLAASGMDPPGDRAPRRPRRYITPGDGHMFERSRTQPITSAERLETDRCEKAVLTEYSEKLKF